MNYFILADAAQEPTLLGSLGGLLPVLIIGVFFIFWMRSSKKKERETNAMHDSLQIGDEVTTIGGIVGRIVSIKEETIVLETTRDKTKIRFLRTAIARVDVKAEETKEAYDKLDRKQKNAAEETADTAETAGESTENAESTESTESK